MKKSLDTILSERQLNWRQHCGQTPNWGLRKPSVMDLSAEALALCRKNPAAYVDRAQRISAGYMSHMLFEKTHEILPILSQEGVTACSVMESDAALVLCFAWLRQFSVVNKSAYAEHFINGTCGAAR